MNPPCIQIKPILQIYTPLRVPKSPMPTPFLPLGRGKGETCVAANRSQLTVLVGQQNFWLLSVTLP